MEGDEGRDLWWKKSRGAGGVEASECAHNGNASGEGSGSERENADPATIRDGTQRAPQAPEAREPP